jgi:hypothetical protein
MRDRKVQQALDTWLDAELEALRLEQELEVANGHVRRLEAHLGLDAYEQRVLRHHELMMARAVIADFQRQCVQKKAN